MTDFLTLEEAQTAFSELKRDLEEALADRVFAFEDDKNWIPLLGGNRYEPEDQGLDLESLHRISRPLREMAVANPWHIRGAQLRHSYVFGRGMMFQGVKPNSRAQKALDDASNKATLFSVDAYTNNNMASFCDGQLIVARNERTDRFTIIPLYQIDATVTNEDDDSDIWYVRRSWTANGKEKVRWIPLARHKRDRTTRLRKTIDVNGKAEPVDQESVVYIKHSALRAPGWTWAIPDSFAAYTWTLAYGGYLQDNAKLVHALSKFAWNITRKSSSNTNKVAAEVKGPGVGGTSVMGDGNVLSSVGVPSAQVNFNHGQPLIAAVAASFGVPVIALISSPGATGGSYGAASTLDAPTLKGFEALQDSWKAFYEEILRDLGSKEATVQFPSIDSDPVHRQITALATLVELKVLHPDEARNAAADMLDVELLHDSPPEPEPDPVGGAVVSAQGVAGAVPGGQQQGETDHDLDNDG